MSKRPFRSALVLALLAALGWLAWWSGGRGASAGAGVPGRLAEGFLQPRAIGEPADPAAPAWITDLALVDLDRDGLLDVVVCDARRDRLGWIRQTAPGVYAEQPIGGRVAGPAHVSAVDFDGDGDLDLLVAAMGQIQPSNEKIGAVLLLENDGHQRFTNRVLVERTFRVTDVEAGDFNGDGRMDVAVAQFGYFEGQVQWLEHLGDGRFAEHPLLELAGAIHAPVVDLDADGRPDIVALVSQDSEEVWAFANRGAGRFESRVLQGSTNKDYGSSGLSVADVNGDGRPDLLYTNGDGFDYATPGARPWHGVQWLENRGGGQFAFHRIGDFPGAYSPVAADLDGDGDQDVVVVSAFNDWKDPRAVSLLVFENDGREHFTPRVLAHAPTHLVVVKAADLRGDGRPELVTGSLGFYPPFDRAARVTLWERRR